MAAKTSWHRYGTKLRHYHPMYCVGNRKDAEGDDVSVLRVDRCHVSDVGEYTCEATNRLGYASDSVIVTGLKQSCVYCE